ncbi:aminotransferase class V-fold PLP-dependent enzyme [bacterium]|nr:MAG: aminotransferase class V-fold PLP-dependent enzyme [bacterium]
MESGIKDYSQDFGPFDGRIWINAAHQGPLPIVAAEMAREAMAWKVSPHLLTTERFREVPRRLKKALGRLMGVPAGQVILGNSASYGIHLLANGIPWRSGDEVLLIKNDFPTDILPWLALEKQGVTIRFLEPENPLPSAQELEESISPATRLLCSTWVHSFSGYTADYEALGDVCADQDVIFVLNGSHALGTRPFDINNAPSVDAVVGVGFKWLCGPYGTGFAWMRPELLETLEYNNTYWQVMLPADYLAKGDRELTLREKVGARRYDVFGTANFFNFHPLAGAVEYLLDVGIETVRDHNQGLVDRLIAGMDKDRYRLLSPESGAQRSTLVYFSHRESEKNEEIFRTLQEKGIDISFRQGKLRAAPHIYNTTDDIDRLLEVLEGV